MKYMIPGKKYVTKLESLLYKDNIMSPVQIIKFVSSFGFKMELNFEDILSVNSFKLIIILMFVF